MDFSDTNVGPIIQEMWDEEKEHLKITERLLAKHRVEPTIFAPLFSTLGYALGTLFIHRENCSLLN